MNEFDKKYRARFEKLSTTNVADAEDALGVKGATYGIRPMRESWGKVVGRAITIKMAAAGETKNKHHLGMTAVSLAEPGDIIIIDNGGRLDTSCWGGSGKQRKGKGRGCRYRGRCHPGSGRLHRSGLSRLRPGHRGLDGQRPHHGAEHQRDDFLWRCSGAPR